MSENEYLVSRETQINVDETKVLIQRRHQFLSTAEPAQANKVLLICFSVQFSITWALQNISTLRKLRSQVNPLFSGPTFFSN